MIGNDIIDLQVAVSKSNWQRKGFLTKIFTDEEQHIVLTAENSFQMVWLLWSMKESAYKAYVQKYYRRFFAPKKFACKLKTPTEGFVLVGQQRYDTHSFINPTYIFTETTNSTFKAVRHNHIEKGVEVTPSRSLHHQIQQSVARKLTIPISELSIRKNTFGVPELFKENKKLEVSLSITHHGNFGAFSILYNCK